MATQRNILIVGGYARQNAGDAALLHAIILQVGKAFPGCLVQIAGMEDPRLHRDFEGVQNLGSMRRYADEEGIPRFVRAARKVLFLTIGMSWFVAPARWSAGRPAGCQQKYGRSWRRSSGPTCSSRWWPRVGTCKELTSRVLAHRSSTSSCR